MSHRWRIAIHEASHATAARLVGLPCRWARVGLDDGAADFPDDCGVASVIALMAGSLGEEIILGGYSAGGCQDWASASAELGDMGCNDHDALIWWCYTRSLMEEHSDAVVRLARALMATDWLDGGEIDALLVAMT